MRYPTVLSVDIFVLSYNNECRANLSVAFLALELAREYLNCHSHVEVRAHTEERNNVSPITIGVRVDGLKNYPQCLGN